MQCEPISDPGGPKDPPPQGVRAQFSSRTCQPILDLNCVGELRWPIRSAVSCDLLKRGVLRTPLRQPPSRLLGVKKPRAKE
jgi:hypothetical protein